MRKINRITAGLVQIGDQFGGEYYLPYSIGILQAYAQKHVNASCPIDYLPIIYKRMKIDDAVHALRGADVVFFSAYLWNFHISLAIAERMKQKPGGCVIVMGGPQIPESPEGIQAFLNRYAFVDLVCAGEGEIPFTKVLEHFSERSWDAVPSIGYRAATGAITCTKAAPAITNLNTIPSPYLSGVFDALRSTQPDRQWSALIETNRGCPYRCAYCYWGKTSRNRLYQFTIDRVYQEIDWISRNGVEFVFCCDSNFGILERDRDIALKVAANKNALGFPKAFSVQNTKNSSAKIFELQKILNDAGLQKGVNLALQSMHADTLKSIHRTNITNNVYADLQRLFTQSGIQTFSDIIIGLPLETYDSFTRGVYQLIESGQHNRIQFINLTILENTEMADPAYQSRYGMIVKESKLIAHHSSIDSDSGLFEVQRLVVGTNAMPPEDFKRVKVFCWLLSLLYFNKLLQLPLALLNRIGRIPVQQLLELFLAQRGARSIIASILDFFYQKANDIQKGEGDFVGSPEWLNIWWPVDEYAFIKLCIENKLDEFYREAEAIIMAFVQTGIGSLSADAVREAILLNRALIKMPQVMDDTVITLHSNLFDVYKGILEGADVALRPGSYRGEINRSGSTWSSWNAWMTEVVWYGTKKGAYLYNCKISKL